MTMIASLPEQNERRTTPRRWLMLEGWASPKNGDERNGFAIATRNISQDGMMVNCLESAAAGLGPRERLHIALSNPEEGGSVDLFGRVAWKEPSIWESVSLNRQGQAPEPQWRFAVVFEDTPVTAITRLMYRDVPEVPEGREEASNVN